MTLVQDTSVVQWETIRDLARSRRIGRLRRSVMTAARLHGDHWAASGLRFKVLMVTLTYRPGERWNSQHVRNALDNAKKWAKRKKFTLRYVWVMELTKAGVPHFHVLLWIPSRVLVPKFDKRGWWPHGMSNTVVAVAPVKYVAKYASKCNDVHNFPVGARLYGIGGLGVPGRVVVRYWRASKFVRGVLGLAADIRPVCGGFVDALTGVFTPSGWRRWIDQDGNLHIEEVQPC